MKKTNLTIINTPIDELIPYVNNSRTHTDEQVTQVASSIKEFGFINPVITDGENGIIAGHCRVLASKKLGLKTVPCIEVKHLSKAQQKAYIIADNKLALNAGWDDNLLKVELEALKSLDFDLSLTGFDDDELKALLEQEESEDEPSPYTEKIASPIYEPKGERPTLNDCINTQRYDDLIDEIDSSSLSEDEKQFLKLAASRHIIFNYEKVAELYACVNLEFKQLLENSAMVIIDYDKAIELGYVQLTEKLKKIREAHNAE